MSLDKPWYRTAAIDMFRRLGSGDLSTTIYFDGQEVRCRESESVAAALLAAGVTRFRTTPVSGADRMPFCMIGTCFDCLVEIDGLADRQACLVPVVDGMRVRTQVGVGTYES